MFRYLLWVAPLLVQVALASAGLDQKHYRMHQGRPGTTLKTISTSVLGQSSASTKTQVSVQPEASGPATSEPTTVPAPHVFVESVPETNLTHLRARATSKRNVLYFTNWGVYGANFQPQQIPADQVTHLLYAFLDIAEDGTVKSSDSYSDLEKHYETDSWNDVGTNAYGCVKQLYLLKKKYRHFKTMLSIGGWTYSYKFAPVAADATKRKQFVTSAIQLLANWGFDGIDVDWEYPKNAGEAADYVQLLKELRAGLDSYAASNGLNYKFALTVATAAGAQNYNVMDLKGMNAYLDAWHLMAYDYAGSWDAVSGHQANLFISQANPGATPFRTNPAVGDYVARGVPANKIVMGMPLYGRSFANTDGPGKPFSGVGGGTLEPGFWLFRDLPRPGATPYLNVQAVAGFSYDPAKREFVSYESIPSAKLKVNYILNRGMGGAMFWEASGDKTAAKSIVRAVATAMGDLDDSPNMLSYPKSIYDNIRKGMP